MKTAAHRKNGQFGYKAVIRYDDGRTYQPVQRNFTSPDEARAYAQKWIDANAERDGWTPRDYAAEIKRKDSAAISVMRQH